MTRSSSTVSSKAGSKLKPFSEIPGPKGTFSVLLEYASEGGLNQIKEISKKRFERFRPIFGETVLGRRVVHISDVDVIADVLQTTPTFHKRPGFDAMQTILKEHGSWLVSNDHEKWYQARSLLSPKMLRPKEVNASLAGFNEVAKDVVDYFRRQAQLNGTVTNIENELIYWAAESIGTFLFGRRLGFYKNSPDHAATTFVRAAVDMIDSFGKLFFFPPIYKYLPTPTYNRLRKSVDTLFAIGMNIVSGNKEKRDEQTFSFFDYLRTNSDFSQQNVLSMAILLLGTGIDTRSTVVFWLIYELSRHTRTQENLYQEIKSILGAENAITSKTISQLVLLKACVKESLRLNPSIIINARIFDQDLGILGYNIPAGVHFMFHSHVTSLDESLYGKNAKEFVPERWLRCEEGQQTGYNPFATLPFGYGVRMCIGRRIAEAEVCALVSQLVLNFRLEYAGERELNHRMSPLVLGADIPLAVKFIPR